MKLAALGPIVTGFGMNLIVAPGGRFVAESVTGKETVPPVDARLKVKVAVWPGSTVWLAVPLELPPLNERLNSRTFCTRIAEDSER